MHLLIEMTDDHTIKQRYLIEWSVLVGLAPTEKGWILV